MADNRTVTLNLFQGLFAQTASFDWERWTLERQSPEVKQLQHDFIEVMA
jgi:hypothetical protein